MAAAKHTAFRGSEENAGREGEAGRWAQEGGGAVAAAAQESAASQMGQSRSSIFKGSLFGRMPKIGRDKIRTISAMGMPGLK